MIRRRRTAEHNRKIGEANKANGRGVTPTKFCPRCKQDLSRADFGVRHNGYSASYCKECDRSYDTLRQRRSKDARPELREKLRRVNRNTGLRRNYGIAVEHYEMILAAQGGRCAICGADKPGTAGRAHLDIDHCHQTGELRGLLCSACNRGLGNFADDPKKLRAAAQYLETATGRWPGVSGSVHYNGKRQR